jgi:hypothetical protein
LNNSKGKFLDGGPNDDFIRFSRIKNFLSNLSFFSFLLIISINKSDIYVFFSFVKTLDKQGNQLVVYCFLSKSITYKFLTNKLSFGIFL